MDEFEDLVKPREVIIRPDLVREIVIVRFGKVLERQEVGGFEINQVGEKLFIWKKGEK